MAAYAAAAGGTETIALAECFEDVVNVCPENLKHVGHSCRNFKLNLLDLSIYNPFSDESFKTIFPIRLNRSSVLYTLEHGAKLDIVFEIVLKKYVV